MKILSALGELSGSFGDITAARNKGGQYFRFRARPTNPQTAKQTLVRERLSQLSKNWSGLLTAPQRAAWKVFADTYSVVDTLGESRNLNGIQMYNRINGALLNAGQAILADPPEDLEVSSSLTMAITAAVGGTNVVDLTYTEDPSADEVLYISGVVNISPGINNVKSLRRFMGISGAAEASPYSFTLPAEYGNLVTGQKVSLLIRRMDTTKGALSPGVVAEAIIT